MVEGKKTVVPYAGIQTFMGRPHRTVPEGDEDVLVLGVPLDTGSSYLPGARLGPSALRRASMIFRFYREDEGLLDVCRERRILRGVKIVDLGDLDLPFGEQEKATRIIYEAAGRLMKYKAFKLFLGGDHSITYPLARAVKEAYGSLAVVQLDSHLDMLESYAGSKYSHGSPMYRLVRDAGVDPSLVFQVGIRGFLNSIESYMNAREMRVNIYPMSRVRSLGAGRVAEEIVERIGETPVYFTLDIDALDPGIAPGTGVVEPGGLTYQEAAELVETIFSKLNVVAMDLVEVSPMLDINDLTAKTGVHLIIEALAAKHGYEQV